MAPPPNPPNPPTPPPSGDDAAARRAGHHAKPARSPLRSTVVRPLRHADPIDAAFVATRLTTLTHDLANLLDGSLRVISLARKSLPDQQHDSRTRRTIDQDSCSHLAHQLTTLHAAMTQMADLVRASMLAMSAGDGASAGLLGIRTPFGALCTLSDAIEHAADVMRPLADERRIAIEICLAPELSEIASGPVYSVVASALRNSIESIATLDSQSAGRIDVHAWSEPGKTGRCVVIEITDDGVGPPEIPATPSAKHDSVFRLGFTTKPSGSGIGLAVSLDVVHQLGGTIQLLGRPRDQLSGRGGAILRVCYPVPPRLELRQPDSDLGRGLSDRAAG